MIENELTNPDLIHYLLSSSQGWEKMTGKVRTKEKCPICKRFFSCVQQLGFICPKHKTSPNKFYVDLFWKGKRIRVFCDKQGQPLDSYQRALNLHAHINYEIENHIFDPLRYIAADLKKYLFENLTEEWLETKEKSNLSQSYIPKLKQYKRDYFQYFKGQDVRDIRTFHVEKFYLQLPEGLRNKTKKNIISALHNFFSWIARLEYIDKMPLFPSIEVEQPQWQWLDVDIQTDILSAIPEGDRYIYVFLALHGCRPSEARALKVKDIDFKHSSVTIRRNFSGKSGNILVEFTKTKR